MDELSFKEGELIMLKARVGQEWLRGKLVSGKEGIFPRNFVEIVVGGVCACISSCVVRDLLCAGGSARRCSG